MPDEHAKADKRAKAQLARAARRLAAGSALPSLILMTDDARLEDPVAAARVLPRDAMVIVRARDRARRIQILARLRSIARRRGLTLLVADDPNLAAEADGLHLPEARAQDAAHWRARHPHWLITVAAHSLRAAARVRHADAVLLSPLFATQSHPGAQALGPARARIIARSLPLAVYALGGIDARNAAAIRASAFTGIAAIAAMA